MNQDAIQRHLEAFRDHLAEKRDFQATQNGAILTRDLTIALTRVTKHGHGYSYSKAPYEDMGWSRSTVSKVLETVKGALREIPTRHETSVELAEEALRLWKQELSDSLE